MTDNLINDITIDGEIFRVLQNDEEQYSIWPAAKPVPDGWHTVLEASPKADCLSYIGNHWTDMRPKSLRDFMEGKKLPSSK